jgi:hypothetical protein
MGKKTVKRGKNNVTCLQTEKGCPAAPSGVLGIDPGLQGHFVYFTGKTAFARKMPIRKIGKITEIVFDDVHQILWDLINDFGEFHVYLERAVPFAMGTKAAFNYGRGFAALEIAIELHKLPVTFIEPNKWAKEAHEGIAKDLKPKAKSLIAVQRLYPKLVQRLPKNRAGKLDEGAVDALLIAGYGHRKQFGGAVEKIDTPDFY